MSDQLARIDRLLWWRRMAAFTVLDVAIVFALLWFTDDVYDPGVHLEDVAIGVGVVWAAGLVFAIRSWLWMIVSAVAVEPRLMQATFLEVLRQSKLPAPSDVGRPARFDYLEWIADDEEAEATERVRAAAIYSLWLGIMKLRGFSASFVMGQAWDSAIQAYDAETRSAQK